MGERIKDYVTGRLVPLSAEEVARQQFEHILVDELGYPKENIAVEFPIQRGSSRRAESADIAVFRSAVHDQGNLYMLVEVEAPGRPFDAQLLSYVTATTAQLAVWFDGLDRRRSAGARHWYRDLARDPTTLVEIPALPSFGQTLEDIGRYRKSQLRPAFSLRGLFQKMHNRLYGEGPLKREDAIAQEVIKLLFCKLYDELHTPGDTCEFRATVSELQTPEGRRDVGSRVRGLFARLRTDPHYADMFSGEELQYDDYWISYVVSELQGVGLTHEETDTDAMGDAYEIFVGPQLKGESGQFFTPRAVVKLAVNLLQPSLARREQIVDPACGSGGFLIYALRSAADEARRHYQGRSQSWISERVREYANNFIAGIDAEPLLYKVAKSYMAIVGNGRTGIFREDALLPPAAWQPKTQSRVQLGRFHVLMTNPPFGTKIKVEVEDTLRQYDVAHVLSDGMPTSDLVRGGQDPAILFLERSWQLLASPHAGRSGGRMAIVLPRQILSGHDRAMVGLRNWILRHMKVLAVVDLPPETFQPYTGTITSVLFAERSSDPLRENYPMFMAVADHVGHDRRGQPLVARQPDGSPVYDTENRPVILDDLPSIAEAHARWIRGEEFARRSPSVFTTAVETVLAQARRRLDAWYYDPTKNEVVKRIWDLDGAMGGALSVRTIDQLVGDPADVFYPGRHRRNYCAPGPDAVPFLSGTNILQVRAFDVKWQPRAYRPVGPCLVQEGWILVTRSGSTGRVLYVGSDLAGFPVSDGVAVSEHVIRIIPDPSEVDPGYLFAFLASESIGKVLLAQGIYASVVRHITPDHIKQIPVPLPPPEVQKAIGERVRMAEGFRAQANSTVSTLRRGIEESVLQGGFDIEHLGNAMQEQRDA
jgi:type I restriction enzyme M protein